LKETLVEIQRKKRNGKGITKSGKDEIKGRGRVG
jgi:hypothetical protein